MSTAYIVITTTFPYDIPMNIINNSFDQFNNNISNNFSHTPKNFPIYSDMKPNLRPSMTQRSSIMQNTDILSKIDIIGVYSDYETALHQTKIHKNSKIFTTVIN